MYAWESLSSLCLDSEIKEYLGCYFWSWCPEYSGYWKWDWKPNYFNHPTVEHTDYRVWCISEVSLSTGLTSRKIQHISAGLDVSPKALQAEQVEFPWKPCTCSCMHIPTWHPFFLWPSQMRKFVLWPLEAGLVSLIPHHASRIIGKGCWFPLGNAIFFLVGSLPKATLRVFWEKQDHLLHITAMCLMARVPFCK